LYRAKTNEHAGELFRGQMHCGPPNQILGGPRPTRPTLQRPAAVAILLTPPPPIVTDRRAAAADRMSASRRRRFRGVFTSCYTPAIFC